MNKKFIMPVLIAAVVGFSTLNIASAGEYNYSRCPHSKMGPPPFHQMSAEDRAKFKAEHEKRKAEMDKRLNLTDEQKQKLDKNREADKKKMEPIINSIRAKKAQIRTISESGISDAEKSKKIDALRADIKKDREKLHEIREANMQKFESILTPAQKTELQKMKQEREVKMKEKFRNGPGCPFPPRDEAPED